MRAGLLYFIIIFAFFSQAQTTEKAFKSLLQIHSLEEVEDLKEAHPNWTIYIKKTLSEGTTYDSLLYHNSIGDTVRISAGNYLHKTIKKGKEDVCKVRYIFLEGKRRNKEQINRLRAEIIRAYRDGTPFLALVRKYSEDGNATGELDWFYEGMMDLDFDTAVRHRSAGQIFTVDVPKRYWYYVVLKEEPNKQLPCSYSVGIQVKQ